MNVAVASPPGVLVKVRDLKVHFPVRKGLFRKITAYVKAVDGIAFDIREGETLGLVGESGCGKTTAGRAILGLLPPTGGEIHFAQHPLRECRGAALRALRADMQLIFQDPFGSLNPRMNVGAIVGEGLKIHRRGSRSERMEKVRQTLLRCGLDPDYADRYPHEFSGGQRQRIGIARALALDPRFIVCDEPVSALDVSIQSQIINLLVALRKELNLTYLFIAHDLSVVEYISDRVAVMYLGKIVELAGSAALYAAPRHPYTRALLAAVPQPDPRLAAKHAPLEGDVPSPLDPPPGCRFHPRCPLAQDICTRVDPQESDFNGHKVWCHAAEDRPYGTEA